MARALLAPVRRGASIRVLDAGCGDGRLLVAVAREASRRGVRAGCEGVELDAAAARWTQDLEPLVRAGARGALAAWRVRHLDFLLDDVDSDYDAAIANPPYVPWRALAEPARARLRARTQHAAGDLAGMFVQRLLQRLRPGGRLCVIVPNKLLAAGYAAELRRALLGDATIEDIWDLSSERIFDGHASYPVVIVARHQPPPARHRIRCREADGALRGRWVQQALRRSPAALVPLGMHPALSAIALRLLEGPRLGNVVRVRCGIATAGFGRAIGMGSENIVRSGHVKAFRLLPAARFSPARAGLVAAQLDRLRCTKVVVPGMFRRLCAAYDAHGRIIGRVYYVPVDGTHAAALQRALLLALFNSRLYALLYAGWFGAVAQSGGYLRLNAPYLESMPWPQQPADGALVRAVEACARRPHDPVERERLDQVVEALFGLAPRERGTLARLARSLPAGW